MTELEDCLACLTRAQSWQAGYRRPSSLRSDGDLILDSSSHGDPPVYCRSRNPESSVTKTQQNFRVKTQEEDVKKKINRTSVRLSCVFLAIRQTRLSKCSCVIKSQASSEVTLPVDKSQRSCSWCRSTRIGPAARASRLPAWGSC